MAARINKTELHEKWREKIRISMILNRLRNHVAGRIEMTPTQVRAAEILLKKAMPDLASTEHTGEIAHTHFVSRLPAPAENAEQWQAQHSPNPIAKTLQ